MVIKIEALYVMHKSTMFFCVWYSLKTLKYNLNTMVCDIYSIKYIKKM